MRKNRNSRCKIKFFIRRFIPKSSSWYNLLSTKCRKDIVERNKNERHFWKWFCHGMFEKFPKRNKNVQLLSEPLRCNYNDVKMTLIRVNQPVHNLHIVAIYRSTSKVKIARFINALKHLHSTFLNDPNTPVIIPGDFSVSLNENAYEKNTLCKYLIEEKKYVQLIIQVTTDYKQELITSTLISLKE